MENESAPSILYSNSNKFRSLYIFIAGFLILIAATTTAFLLGQKYSNTPGNGNLNELTQLPPSSAQGIFQNQSAVIDGNITQNQNGVLTIVNAKNETSMFPVSSDVTIYKQIPGQKIAQTTSGLNALELNKQAVITLSAQDGQYVVSSISYLTLPPPPPSSTQR